MSVALKWLLVSVASIGALYHFAINATPWCRYTPWYIATEGEALSFAGRHLSAARPELFRCLNADAEQIKLFNPRKPCASIATPDCTPSRSNRTPKLSCAYYQPRTYAVRRDEGKSLHSYRVTFWNTSREGVSKHDRETLRTVAVDVRFDACGIVEFASCARMGFCSYNPIP